MDIYRLQLAFFQIYVRLQKCWFKKDNELLCENYRPISLLPIFSKIFEKVVYVCMYSFLSENNLIYDRQFGLRSTPFNTSHRRH